MERPSYRIYRCTTCLEKMPRCVCVPSHANSHLYSAGPSARFEVVEVFDAEQMRERVADVAKLLRAAGFREAAAMLDGRAGRERLSDVVASGRLDRAILAARGRGPGRARPRLQLTPAESEARAVLAR